MITSPYLFKQHKFTIISTIVLLVVAFPILLSSPAGYVVFAAIILIRGSLLYSAVAYGIEKGREEYATRVVTSNIFRKALANHILQMGGAERVLLES